MICNQNVLLDSQIREATTEAFEVDEIELMRQEYLNFDDEMEKVRKRATKFVMSRFKMRLFTLSFASTMNGGRSFRPRRKPSDKPSRLPRCTASGTCHGYKKVLFRSRAVSGTEKDLK